MAANVTVIGADGYDRAQQLKQFDDSKLGVKGLVIMSNEGYKSVEHRVLANPSSEARVSVVVFMNPSNIEGVFGPLPELVTPEKPALYKVFNFSEFMTTFLTEGLDGKTLANYYKL